MARPGFGDPEIHKIRAFRVARPDGSEIRKSKNTRFRVARPGFGDPEIHQTHATGGAGCSRPLGLAGRRRLKSVAGAALLVVDDDAAGGAVLLLAGGEAGGTDFRGLLHLLGVDDEG